MSKIAQTPEMIEQVPQYLYHKILIHGRGKPATHIKKATFQFSLYDLHGRLMACGTIKDTELKDLIPGMTHLLVGMRRQEERKAYIHPKFCYGLFPDASPIRVNVQLVDFEEGDEDMILPHPIELSLRYFEPVDVAAVRKTPDYFNEGPFLKELADFLPFIQKYKKQLKNSYIKFGYDCCEKLQKAGISFDLKTFTRLLRSPQNKQMLQTQEEMRQFIIDFNCFITSMESEGLNST